MEAAPTTSLDATDVTLVPTRSAEDALRLVPGLTVVQHGSEGKGYQYFLRGFDASHGADLEVSVEGIPINEWSNIHAQGYLDLAFVPVELIESVQVIKGPFALEQGAFGMAGTAEYRLGVAPSELGVRAGYTLGSTGRQRLALGYSPRTGDGNQFVMAEIMNDPSFGEARHARRASAMGRVHLLDDARRGRLSLLASAYAADAGLPGTVRPGDVQEGRLGFYDAYFDGGQLSSLRALGSLHYALTRGGHTVRAVAYASYRRLRLFENFTGDLLDPVNGDYRSQRQNTLSFGGQLRYRSQLRPRVALEAGLGLRGDRLLQAEDQVTAERDLVTARRGLAGGQLLGHTLLGLDLRPLPALRASLGARADWVHLNVHEQTGAREQGRGDLFAFSPRARVAWRVSQTLRLFSAYGRGLRPPEARAFTRFRPGSMGVAEEAAAPGRPRFTQSHTVEAGAHLHPSDWLRSDLTGFATLIDRESVFDHVSGLNLELNGTRRLGGELVLRALPTSWLQLLGDVTAVDARFRESGNRVPFAPWLTWGARAVFTHPSGVRAGLRWLAIASRPLPYGARGEPLYLLDAVVGYRWRFLRVDVALENLLFRELREGEYYFASHWYQDEPRSQLPTPQYVAGPPFNARLTIAIVY